MTRRLVAAARTRTGLAAAALAMTGLAATGLAATSCTSSAGTPARPDPPVTAAAFRFADHPHDNDNRIPAAGAVTPSRQPCSVTFVAAAGATIPAVNDWIAAHQASDDPVVVCLAGTFAPRAGGTLRVRRKVSRALLTVRAVPGRTAVLDLSRYRPDPPVDTAGSPDSVLGAVSVVDSRDVEISGLTIRGLHSTATDYTDYTPAGISVSVSHRHGERSACYRSGACSDVYLLHNTVTDIASGGDRWPTTRDARFCAPRSLPQAYGIAVRAFGDRRAQARTARAAHSRAFRADGDTDALQHVVISGNTVTRTRTGQSETVTVDGDVKDFRVDHNVIRDVDNIGIDVIGWENGAAQARAGYVAANRVTAVDARLNLGYMRAKDGRCAPHEQSAAGIYADGASYVWFDRNTLTDTNQGLDLDVEADGRFADDLLATDNSIVDGPGRVAATVGLFLDAFGSTSRLAYVTAIGNTVDNRSRARGVGLGVDATPGARWDHVWVHGNTVLGTAGVPNPLVAVDTVPAGVGTSSIDCNAYRPGGSGDAFTSPDDGFATLVDWRKHWAGSTGWDAHSVTGTTPPRTGPCPATLH